MLKIIINYKLYIQLLYTYMNYILYISYRYFILLFKLLFFLINLNDLINFITIYT